MEQGRRPTDWYYYPPGGGKRCRSLVEVRKILGAEVAGGDGNEGSCRRCGKEYKYAKARRKHERVAAQDTSCLGV